VQWIRDEVNQAKKLGHTIEDIGGQLESIKVTLDLGSWGLTYTRQGNNPGREAECLLMPNVSALQGTVTTNGVSAAIVAGFQALRDSAAWSGTTTQAYNAFHSGTNPFQISGASALDSDGTFAINQCRPTTPAVDLATSVAEFVSEGGRFASIPGTGGSLGDEWLNYSLAISPNIGTVHDLRSAMEHQEKLISQYERDAGRLIRRRFDPDFWLEKDARSVTQTNVLPMSWDAGNIGALSIVSGRGTQTSIQKITRHRWFSGAFTYPLPDKGWRRTLQELDHVYGFTPGVDTAWELVPFSFVADYFTNLGDVFSNLDSFAEDGLVMPYGYIMQRKIFEADVRWNGPIWAGSTTKNVELTAHVEVDVRQRRAATPFGFGFSWSDITPRQVATLAALVSTGR